MSSSTLIAKKTTQYSIKPTNMTPQMTSSHRFVSTSVHQQQHREQHQHKWWSGTNMTVAAAAAAAAATVVGVALSMDEAHALKADEYMSKFPPVNLHVRKHNPRLKSKDVPSLQRCMFSSESVSLLYLSLSLYFLFRQDCILTSISCIHLYSLSTLPYHSVL
jgi:hypothetical protein